MKKDVDSIFVHHSNGIAPVRVIAFIKLNYVTGKMIVQMVPMKRIAVSVFSSFSIKLRKIEFVSGKGERNKKFKSLSLRVDFANFSVLTTKCACFVRR